MAKYTHLESLHNTDNPNILVPLFYDIVKPKSVVDVGCGLATFLHVFEQKYGVTDVLGIDGTWVDKNKLSKYISVAKFVETDLEKPIELSRKFDLALCLEVSEHLKEQSAQTIVQSLTNISDVVIFSAAIPNQLGDNHLNEQWADYWQALFAEKGFRFYDCIRPLIWENDQLFYWYKQNMFLAIKEEHPLSKIYKPCIEIERIVHPDLLKIRTEQLLKIWAGERGVSFYFPLLLKSIFYKIRCLFR
jgi:SAM-dependent methyltransferase